MSLPPPTEPPAQSVPPPVAYFHPGPPPELPEVPDGVVPKPRWPVWTAPVALIGALVGANVAGLFVAVIGLAAGADLTDPPPAVNIASTFLLDATFIVTALIFARIGTKPRATHFGLRPVRIWWAKRSLGSMSPLGRRVATLAIVAGVLIAAYIAFVGFTAIVSVALGASEGEDNTLDQLGGKDNTVALVFLAFIVCVGAPIAEEFFFRGFFFGALRGWKGVWPAAIITGLSFGLIHILNFTEQPLAFAVAAVIGLSFFGFVLCLLYWLTDSLVPCIVLHALNNCIAFGVSVDWFDKPETVWRVVALAVAANLLIAAFVLPFSRERGRRTALAAA